MAHSKDLCWKIPSGIDLESVLKKHPPTFKYKIDYFFYILDYLSSAMELEDLDNSAGFINMNAQKLQTFIREYKKYVQYLKEHLIIYGDGKIIVGQKSQGYKLSVKRYEYATQQEISIKDRVIRRKIRTQQNEQRSILRKTKQKYHYLTKWFNSDLVIDVGGALKKVEELFPPQAGGIRGTRRGKPSKSSKRFKAIQSIKKFEEQDFYYNVDDNVGRFHSNLTNIKRELRHFITYKGQKLVNIDIKNSQPLFSTLLLREEFYNQKNQNININIITKGQIPQSPNLPSHKKIKLTKLPLSSSYIILVKTLQKANNEILTKYVDFVNSGEFYKKISEVIYPNKPFDKGAIKKLVYSIFFSSNRYLGQPGAEPKRDFKTHFPGVYSIFSLIKKNNHQALAVMLQRIESTIMVHNASLRISAEKPDLPIFTIHDSIATTVVYEAYVEQVIQEVILKLTALKASLDKEYWGGKGTTSIEFI